MDERFVAYAGRREGSSIEVYDSVAYFVVAYYDKAYFFSDESVTYIKGCGTADAVVCCTLNTTRTQMVE